MQAAVLTRAEAEAAVGDHHVEAPRVHRQRFHVAHHEGGLGEAALRGPRGRLPHLLRRDIQPHHSAPAADLAGGQEGVDAEAGAQVEHRLALAQPQRGRLKRRRVESARQLCVRRIAAVQPLVDDAAS